MRDAKLAAVLLLALTGGASAVLTEAECGVISEYFTCYGINLRAPTLTEAECDTTVCQWSDGACSFSDDTLTAYDALATSDTFNASYTAARTACEASNDCQYYTTNLFTMTSDTTANQNFCYYCTSTFTMVELWYYADECISNGYPMPRLTDYNSVRVSAGPADAPSADAPPADAPPADASAALNAAECRTLGAYTKCLVASNQEQCDTSVCTYSGENCAPNQNTNDDYDALPSSTRIAASINAGNTACAAATDCNILSTNSFTLYNDDGTSFLSRVNTCDDESSDSCIYSLPIGLVDECVSSGLLSNDFESTSGAIFVAPTVAAVLFCASLLIFFF